MRSAAGAKHTAEFIKESVRNDQGRVELNAEARANLEEIPAQVLKVSEAMAEIAAASAQQSTGVDRITTAIEQMNQVSQQAPASAEELASAACTSAA